MKKLDKLSTIFDKSKEISFNDNSKIIIMSDCHRGINNLGDNFSKNKSIFIDALRYYYLENYTYIEIGDGDELWENKYLEKIIDNHLEVFLIMSMFYKNNRLHMLFGNHDITKINIIENSILNNYYDKNKKTYISLFPGIKIDEGLKIKYVETNDQIFLTHGHQGDFFNDTIWKISRFLIRNLYRPIELIGINISSQKIFKYKKTNVEKKLISWSMKNKQLLIAGHTHRPVFPKIGDSLYFNDGCCIKQDYITGIEINKGEISLIKWSKKNHKNGKSFVKKDILYGPMKLKSYFNNLK